MERFLVRLLAGGCALVAGLWLERALAPWTAPWVGALCLVAAGVAGLAAGVGHELSR